MGSSESEGPSERDRARTSTRSPSAGPSRRASTTSSTRSPLSGPQQLPPLPAVPPLAAAPQQRPQQVAVETETVPSVPTLAVVSSAANGSLRVKRSQESVPRLPQSKATKKRSQRLTQGSKADIFAAKVANAVDEQNSSGSDETFVYDTAQPSQQLQPSAPAPPLPHTSATPSLAGDSLRRPYRSTGSVASASGTPHAPQGHFDNSYFASLSSQPGYETDDYSIDGEDDCQESYGGQTTPPQQWPPGNNGQVHLSAHYQHQNPQHSQQQQQQQQHPSPRSFVVPKQNLQGRQRPPVSPGIPQPHPFTSQDSSTEGYGGYTDPTVSRGTSSREAMDPRTLRLHAQRQNSRSRHPSRSGIQVDDEALPARDLNNSIRAKTLYLQRWRTPAHSSRVSLGHDAREPEEELDERASLLRGRPSLYNYHARSTNGRRRLAQAGYQGTPARASRFERDPESLPGFSHGADADADFGKYTSHTSLGTKLIVGSVTILICLLSLAFVVGLLIAASQPLQDFDVVSLSDAFVSDKELVFSMILHARNPGIFATSIYEGELDIFATSGYLSGGLGEGSVVNFENEKLKTRTVLLGTVRSLESPVVFHGGVGGPSVIWETASVKLVDPLANNTQEWSNISTHEFDLTVKGVLSYKVLGSEYRETVSTSYHVLEPGFLDSIHPLA